MPKKKDATPEDVQVYAEMILAFGTLQEMADEVEVAEEGTEQGTIM